MKASPATVVELVADIARRLTTIETETARTKAAAKAARAFRGLPDSEGNDNE